MRKSFYALLVLFLFSSVQAQVVLKEPVGNAALKSARPTFKWGKTAAAVNGYEFCLLVNNADSSNALLPLSADVNKWKRYVRVGTTANDTTFTMDSTLARTTAVRAWKVRAKTATGFGSWVYQNGKFTMSLPLTSVSTANAIVQIDHDVYSAVRKLTFVDGSNKQIVDTTYNDTKKFGIGSAGLLGWLGTRDTLASWSSNGTDTATFTYRNGGKYGYTGSKALTLAYNASGVTVDVATTLENGKTVYLSSAFKPGGVVDSNDNVIVVDNLTASKTTYPTALATLSGTDTIMVRGMYDKLYNEYFGFKSSSSVVVADSQSTGLLKQSVKLANTSGSTATYTVSFAVRKSRGAFFDVWANNRPIFVSNLTAAAGDTLARGNKYVTWESFGAKPDTIQYSADGTTFGSAAVIGKDTVAVDSAQYRIPNGVYNATSVIKVISTKGDVGLSAAFKVNARTLAVTSPKVTDSFTPDSVYVVWTNTTPATVTKVSVSVDSGATYSAPITVSSTAAVDSVLFYFKGNSTKCFVKVATDGLDTSYSALFTLARTLAITTPAAASTVTPGPSYIVWSNYTADAITKIRLSLDSGKTYTDSVTFSSSTEPVDSVQYTFNGSKTSSAYCFLQASTADGIVATSGRFAIGSGGAVFTMPPAYGDPASTVLVPVNFFNGVAGDSLKAFDFMITFDSSKVHYQDYVLDAKIGVGKWIVAVDSSHKAGANASYVRVSGFKLPAGVGIKSSELLKLEFLINDNQSNIGSTATLDITNGVLSAAGNNALALSTTGTADGSIGVYSSVEGTLRYLHAKWEAFSSYTITGDSLVTYTDNVTPANNGVYNTTDGFFKMSSRQPNHAIVVTPSASKYMATGLAAIDVADAQLAFRDWTDTLQIRARITADVNGDSLINTTDAMAIMEISVDSTYLSRVEQTSWIFVDSTSLVGFESRSDSLTAWYSQKKHSIASTLTNQQTNQDFFGVLRGDVNFSFNAAAVKTMKKSHAAPVLFSTDEIVKARPGEVVWIPMNISCNGEKVGGFNSSLQLDPAVFTYTGEFKVGPTVPAGKNWYITAKADAKGVLKVAGTDFSYTINPITEDGPAVLFKYIVNKETKRGTTTPIGVNTQTVVDSKLMNLASETAGGEAEISRMGASVVTDYELSQNYPNPFNPSTVIEYALPKDSKVDIRIYNVLGQQVATLFSGVQTVGYHQVDFNASQMSSGIYFYTIKASAVAGGADFHAVKKMMLVK